MSARLQTAYDALLELARRKHVPVPGHALGEKPSFFVVADAPTERDVSLGQPFTGAMNEVLVNLMDTLGQKYGARPEDFYVTYLVKCRFKENDLTEKQVNEEWLPLLQLEYALSGCSQVVCIGKMARLFAGHVQHLPPQYAAQDRPRRASWRERFTKAWQVLTA